MSSVAAVLQWDHWNTKRLLRKWHHRVTSGLMRAQRDVPALASPVMVGVQVDEQAEEVGMLRAQAVFLAEQCGAAEGELDAHALKLQQASSEGAALRASLTSTCLQNGLARDDLAMVAGSRMAR
jgi:hypothetical protein